MTIWVIGEVGASPIPSVQQSPELGNRIPCRLFFRASIKTMKGWEANRWNL